MRLECYGGLGWDPLVFQHSRGRQPVKSQTKTPQDS